MLQTAQIINDTFKLVNKASAVQRSMSIFAFQYYTQSVKPNTPDIDRSIDPSLLASAYGRSKLTKSEHNIKYF